MKQLVLAVCAACALSVPAFADTPLSADETKQATAAAAAWGCEGGKWEKETEGTGVYELDDAKCKDGRAYDLKFDKDFKLLNMSAD
ncbi:PepSY domain-containing protein [Hyphomicrobium sp.]|uniref:PepSY domain-containing protein n=1 Tax=Hyphomicrobium sp. TaxID=82 RepID=UPI002D793F54|nr:PepSY domain-containing protein [Hyphomicrobium sp.]HET6388831.1 PepSY domain-containing protein [Hyphomicrobium sp.]